MPCRVANVKYKASYEVEKASSRGGEKQEDAQDDTVPETGESEKDGVGYGGAGESGGSVAEAAAG